MLKAHAIGYLGQDATVNNVNGKNVINFSMAHSEKVKQPDGSYTDKTIWISCSKWEDGPANVAQHMKKGTQVYVEGIPSVRTYQKQDGSTAANLDMKVFTIQLLGSSQNQQNQGQQHQPAAQYPPDYSQRQQQNQQGYQQGYQQQPQPGYGAPPSGNQYSQPQGGYTPPPPPQGNGGGYTPPPPPPPPPAQQPQQGNMFNGGQQQQQAQPQGQYGQQPYQAPQGQGGALNDLPF